jgi:hypothetical protein
MNTTRSAKLIFGTALMIVALLALQACTTSGSAKNSNSSYVGMGDLHRFEAQVSTLGTAAEANNSAYVGMGDLHRFEAQSSRSSYAGMGDLHRFEAQQEIQYAEER